METTIDIENTLLKQTIDENQPASILRNFEIFLNFVATNDLAASGKKELLPIKSLPDLNALLTKPFDIKLNRPVQKSFPNINGLFLLGRASGLLILQRRNKKTKLAIDQELLKIWQNLNPTERYFTLFEAWIVRSSNEMIGESDNISENLLDNLKYLFDEMQVKSLKYKDHANFFDYSLRYFGLHNIALAEMFGWFEIKHKAGEKDKGWLIKQISSTDFGRAIFAVLQNIFRKIEVEWRVLETADGIEIDPNNFNLLQPIFQPFFPAWQNSFQLPPKEITEGIFVFKVSLNSKIWRRIAISSDDFLEDLHLVIQQVFAFDNDHLYQFSFRNRFGATQCVTHPMCNEDFSADEFRINSLPLRIGEKMEYLFDFGDDWEFTIELEEVQPPNPKFSGAEIREVQGKSPKQYPDWDDDDE